MVKIKNLGTISSCGTKMLPGYKSSGWHGDVNSIICRIYLTTVHYVFFIFFLRQNTVNIFFSLWLFFLDFSWSIVFREQYMQPTGLDNNPLLKFFCNMKPLCFYIVPGSFNTQRYTSVLDWSLLDFRAE